MRWVALCILLMSGRTFGAAISVAAVKAFENDKTITVGNGLIEFVMDKGTGRVTSLKGMVKGEMTELGEGTGKTIYMHYIDAGPDGKTIAGNPVQEGMVRLVGNSPEEADVMAGTMPTADVPFQIEWHLILRRGESGIYSYLSYRHGKEMGAANFVQAGFVVRGVSGQELFTHYVVDDNRSVPYPATRILKELQDTTWLYEGGIVQAKYDYCIFTSENAVFGMAGDHGVGMWMLMPSWEYENGGPLHQELSVHQGPLPTGVQTNIMQWIVQGEHFWRPRGLPVKANEEWSRFYGPMFIYINQGENTASLWEDAKKREKQEEVRWPYDFIHETDYPLVRGTVVGRVHLADGESVKGAWVVLTAEGEEDWAMSSKGYEFWTKEDSVGRFSIGKVRPGKYRIFVSGGDQFEDFHEDGVKVQAGNETDLGTLEWKPLTHGKKLWEIGVADRSTHEFKRGDDVRHYDNYIRYLTDFSNDVNFVIGKSKEQEDWNFAQWGWYAKHPYWSVVFDSVSGTKRGKQL